MGNYKSLIPKVKPYFCCKCCHKLQNGEDEMEIEMTEKNGYDLYVSNEDVKDIFHCTKKIEVVENYFK